MSKERENQDSRVGIWCQLGVLIIGIALIAGSLGYLVGATAPASAPPTVIDWEGLEAYKINGIRYALGGTTDAIQDAIDDLPDEGGLVVVPNGTYTWTTEFVPTGDNWALTGSPSTTIIISGDTNGTSIANAQNVTVCNLNFDGDKETKTIAKSCIKVSASTNIVIRDIHVDNWYGNCLWVESSTNVTVEDNTISDSDQSDNWSHITIWNCINVTVEHNIVDDAISINGNGGECSNIKVVGNTVYGHAISHGGIYAYRGAHHVLIDSNTVSGFQHGAIEARAENVTITNNILTDSYCGVQVECAHENDVTRNVIISNNIITDNIYEGIEIVTSGFSIPQYITITDNLIASNGRFGIRSVAGISNLDISNNLFRLNTDWPLYILSTNVTISGNEIYQPQGTEAIRVQGQNISITGNRIADFTTSGYGIHVTGSKDIQMSGNYINSIASGYGIYLTTVNRFTVTDNWIEAVSYGIYTINADNGSISDNFVTKCTSSGLYITTSEGLAIDGNIAIFNNIDGIHLSGCSFSTIVGNVANNNERTAAGNAGIRLGNCHNITVVSNIAMDSSLPKLMSYGLYISGTNNHIYVAFNIFSPVLGSNYTGSTGTFNFFYANI